MKFATLIPTYQNLKIKNHMNHKFKRSIQRIGLSFAKRIRPAKKKFSPNEIQAGLVFKNILKNENSEIISSYLSKKFYIKNDDKKILLVLHNNKLSIINHVFGYDIEISYDFLEYLTTQLNNELLQRGNKLEGEYSKSVNSSLKSILTK
jgi:hypothetical protein